MEISLDMIEDLAPDQASLNAAKKLLSPAKWPIRGQQSSVNTIWGQVQGSGSKPYFTVANVVDHGYKCTCPSRKFPCKHVLALLWQYSQAPSEFTEEAPPEWVNDWLGRRRKNTATSPTKEDDKPKPKKNIALADVEKEKQLSSEERAKKEAAKLKRASQIREATDSAISTGLLEFQQWVDDQLRTGIGSFTKEINERCRRIAARLVDAKAANLASRIDELPAKIYTFPPDQQMQVIFKELGQLVLLSEAWFTNQNDPDVRRTIGTTENRDQTLQSKDTLRKSGVWETVGEKVFTRRDGLISHTTWLLKVDENDPCFALLLDHYPASAGKREAGLGIGTQINAEIAFYKSASPLRGVLVKHQILTSENTLQGKFKTIDIWKNYTDMLALLPWSESCPHLLGEGSIQVDTAGRFWWKCQSNNETIPLLNTEFPAMLLGNDLSRAFAVWDGERAEILSAYSQQWGLVPC